VGTGSVSAAFGSTCVVVSTGATVVDAYDEDGWL